MSRPELTPSLAAEEFLDFYWLKKELTAFCRAAGLAAQGSKQALTARIAHFLRTGERLAPERPKRQKAQMPAQFSRETMIQAGWRCSQPLRQFFEQEIGARFHFNQFLREFIRRDGVGQTLGAAIEGWERSKQAAKGTREIGKQFEYNRFVRCFYQEHPTATRTEVVVAWRAHRATRVSVR